MGLCLEQDLVGVFLRAYLCFRFPLTLNTGSVGSRCKSDGERVHVRTYLISDRDLRGTAYTPSRSRLSQRRENSAPEMVNLRTAETSATRVALRYYSPDVPLEISA